MRITFIHSFWKVCDLFDRLAAEHLPGRRIGHIADDTIIQQLLAHGGLTPEIRARLNGHVEAAAAAGADVIQLTCLSVTPCVADAAARVPVPVLAVDEPMMAQAVKAHRTVGVIATNPATLAPSVALAERFARDGGGGATVVPRLVAGAYQAFFAGDLATHDRLVRDALAELMRETDAVCLAQASMERIVAQLDGALRTKPVYSSPLSAIQRLAEVVRGLAVARG